MGVYPSFNFWMSFCFLHPYVENNLWSLSRATVLFVTLPAKIIHEGSGKDSCRGCAPDLLIEFVALGCPVSPAIGRVSLFGLILYRCAPS